MLKKVLIALLVVCLLMKFMKRRPSLPKAPYFVPMPEDDRTETTPVMYGRDSCPYTVKMKNQLQAEGVMDKFEYVDVTTEAGGQRFAAAGGEGVPYFELNGRVAVGSMPTSKLFKMLGMA